MLGRLITMVAGRSIARQVGGVASGPMGLVAGALLPTVLRRLGPGGIVAAAVGGYAYKKYADGKKTVASPPRPKP